MKSKGNAVFTIHFAVKAIKISHKARGPLAFYLTVTIVIVLCIMVNNDEHQVHTKQINDA